MNKQIQRIMIGAMESPLLHAWFVCQRLLQEDSEDNVSEDGSDDESEERKTMAMGFVSNILGRG